MFEDFAELYHQRSGSPSPPEGPASQSDAGPSGWIGRPFHDDEQLVPGLNLVGGVQDVIVTYAKKIAELQSKRRTLEQDLHRAFVEEREERLLCTAEQGEKLFRTGGTATGRYRPTAKSVLDAIARRAEASADASGAEETVFGESDLPPAVELGAISLAKLRRVLGAISRAGHDGGSSASLERLVDLQRDPRSADRVIGAMPEGEDVLITSVDHKYIRRGGRGVGPGRVVSQSVALNGGEVLKRLHGKAEWSGAAGVRGGAASADRAINSRARAAGGGFLAEPPIAPAAPAVYYSFATALPPLAPLLSRGAKPNLPQLLALLQIPAFADGGVWLTSESGLRFLLEEDELETTEVFLMKLGKLSFKADLNLVQDFTQYRVLKNNCFHFVARFLTKFGRPYRAQVKEHLQGLERAFVAELGVLEELGRVLREDRAERARAGERARADERRRARAGERRARAGEMVRDVGRSLQLHLSQVAGLGFVSGGVGSGGSAVGGVSSAGVWKQVLI